MNKRKLPAEWAKTGSESLSPKQPKTSVNQLMDDSDMDALLLDIDFDEAMEVDATVGKDDADDVNSMVSSISSTNRMCS